MSDPYLPPRADDAPADQPVGAWTIRSILGGMWRAFRRQPFGASVALLIIPLCWATPAEWLRRSFVPEEWAELGGERQLYVILASWCVLAWNSIIFPGAQLAALSLATGAPIRWRDFVEGVRKVPVALLLTFVIGIPLDLVDLVPLPPIVDEVTLLLTFLGVLYLSGRTMIWAPLLFVTRASFWQGFELSWEATRGHGLRLVALLLSLVPFALPLILVDVIATPRWLPLGVHAFGALALLAAAQIYVSTSAVASASVSTGRKSTSSVPPISAA